MSGNAYAILGYTAGLGLFWSYAAAMWLTARSLKREHASHPVGSAPRTIALDKAKTVAPKETVRSADPTGNASESNQGTRP